MTTLDIKEVVKILPHRYPFLLVDRILEMDIEKGTILGQKNVTYNEPFFQGHFPDAPIMPGVLILEALAQAGGVLVHLKSQQRKIAVLLNVNNAKFRYPVRPGDILLLKAEGIHFSSKGGRVKVEALVQDKIQHKLAAEAEIGFALVDPSQI
jgi:3-hydroxyacyl-[acyl-carrier-protein] dehydratase